MFIKTNVQLNIPYNSSIKTSTIKRICSLQHKPDIVKIDLSLAELKVVATIHKSLYDYACFETLLQLLMNAEEESGF